MSNQITYDDKVDLNVATEIANINKVTAADMNEIKQVVNAIDTETNTNITEILQAINNPTYTTTEGTDLSIENTRVGKMKFEYFGNTEQETTTGKNLFSLKTFTSTSSNRIIGDSATIQGIPVTTGQQYTASFDVTTLPSSDYRVQIIVSSDSTQTQGSTDPTNILSKENVTANSLSRFIVSITPSANAYIYLRCVPAGFVLDNIQLEKGTATTYEKYTGGIASPNPSYPQEVKTVTGENTIDIVGKNEININNYLEAYPNENTGEIISISDARCYWARVKPNETYTFSREKGDRLMILGSNEKPKIGNYMTLIVDDGNSTATSKTFTNGNFDYILIYSSRTSENRASWIMLEKGSTATTYEPYQSQSYEINLGSIELCDIEEHQDYIYDNGGKWFKHKEVGKRTLNGTENWNNASNNYPVFNVGIFTDKVSGQENFKCNNFSYLGNAQTTLLGYALSFNTDTFSQYMYIQVPSSVVSQGNVTAFKSWLSANLATVYYPLKTPIEEEITEPTLINQLNAIKYGAESYYGQTNIIITSEELQPTLKVQTLGKIGD